MPSTRHVGIAGANELVTRWDPESRAGAVSIHGASKVRCLEEVSTTVTDWARYLDLTGELDSVETSSISGRYDWRSYVQEETEIAMKRDRPRDAKDEPAAAPTQYYV